MCIIYRRILCNLYAPIDCAMYNVPNVPKHCYIFHSSIELKNVKCLVKNPFPFFKCRAGDIILYLSILRKKKNDDIDIGWKKGWVLKIRLTNTRVLNRVITK